MTDMIRHDRLWPVLTAMVAFLAAAVAVEVGMQGREAPPHVVAIEQVQDVAGGSRDDGDDAGDDGDTAIDDDAAPVDEVHARARTLAHRGDAIAALPLFAQSAAAHPDDGHLAAELGYWQLALDHTADARASLERARTLLPDDPLIALNLSVAASRAGDDVTAEAEARRALALDPHSGAAKIVLGRLLRRTHRTAEAIAILEEAARAGGNEQRARAGVALGRALLDAGRGDDADAALTRAVELAPASAELRLAIARAYLASRRDGDVGRATAVLVDAIRIAPDAPALHAALGRAREKQADAAAAEQAYERVLRLDPAYHYARRRLLRIALDREDFPRARLHAEYLLRGDPDAAEHHFLAGLVAAKDGRVEDARRHYADALAHAGDVYPEAWFNLGILEKNAGRLDAAIAAYEQALAQRPDYLAALNNLGLVLGDAGRAADAEAAFRRAIDADPSYAAAWLNLGELYADQQRWDDAADAQRRAIAAKPGYPRARLNLSAVLRKAGRAAEAIEIAEQLVADQPRYVSAWVALGAARADTGDLADAARALERALALDPDHAIARRTLAGVLAKRGDLAGARAAYEELLDRVPDDRAGRVGLAEVLAASGDRAGCARAVRVVLARDPDDRDAQRLAASCGAH
jgi:tetratricopeptide (TPR) repeat protein